MIASVVPEVKTISCSDARVQKAGDLAAHGLVLVGRKVRKVVQAPVNVGIFHRIGLRDRVDHHLRLLRRGAVVQIDQRLAVHLPRQDRKIARGWPCTSYMRQRPRSTSRQQDGKAEGEQDQRRRRCPPNTGDQRLEAVQFGHEVGQKPEETAPNRPD